ncbi:uncharacterized protein LOC123565381 [Mercenaria mercenaria]|uniref:uncharacterized protein LOC123565381 n=1 Tax=Mercenaria mercenaria TaxID=6596 RepID=UPI00234F0F5D|nr:uncharacterized protein LOC123565381 [Mercenaria mercenaria]
MDLSRTELYRAIKSPNISSNALWNMCNDFVNSKKNINVADNVTGENFLHVLAGHGDQLTKPQGVKVLYLLGSSGIHLDTRDRLGETCLHKAVRVPGSYRIVEALMRCGVDPLIRNDAGQTAEEVLKSERPEHWKHTLHWLSKYTPGLYHTLNERDVDTKQVERLLKGWCRTRLPRPDGQEVDLVKVVETADDIQTLLEKYSHTNEFAVAMLAGKSFHIEDGTKEHIDIETKDHMHEGDGPRAQRVPKPILMAAWEAHIETSVETILNLGASTTTLFSKSGSRTEAEPLFFHLITNDDKPPDSIIHKILIVSNMSFRNQRGQTLLFKAIHNDFSRQFIKALFKYGVDVAARDDRGRTARDYAEQLKKTKYFTEIDEHVIDIVKTCDKARLEQLVLEGYDHILDITDNKGINVVNVLKRHFTPNDNKDEVLKLMEKLRAIQHHLTLMFRATDTGGTEEMRRLASRKFASARDKCGRTILHKAILNKKKDMIKLIVQNYKYIIDARDNLGRCALHYAYLVTERTSLVNYLLLHGANPHIADWAGRCPGQYHIESCGRDEYVRLQRALNGFTMDVYLAETNFEQSLLKAVKKGDLLGVEDLVVGLVDKGDINRYANILFHCVDTGRQHIAVYLIQQGMRTDIYKQYENCNARDSACSTYTCDHDLTSLYTRAKQLKCYDVLRAIDHLSLHKSSGEMDGRPSITKPSTMDQLSLLGLV